MRDSELEDVGLQQQAVVSDRDVALSRAEQAQLERVEEALNADIRLKVEPVHPRNLDWEVEDVLTLVSGERCNML